MKFMATNLIISLLLFTSIIGIGVFIQVKLSRSKNKYLGLIMPVISFLLSILIILNIAAFTVFTSDSTTTTEIITNNGIEEKIEESVEITENLGKDVITFDVAISMFFVFLVANIPTVILGGIYLNERNKIDVKKSIEKMKIDDL
ncbi:TPA: hypothetical protein HPU08_002886 [Listeria monocytogenes]|nr:hypothetical protein [Listeria monocytogenes]